MPWRSEYNTYKRWLKTFTFVGDKPSNIEPIITYNFLICSSVMPDVLPALVPVCLALNLRFICLQKEYIIEYQDSYVCLTCKVQITNPLQSCPICQLLILLKPLPYGNVTISKPFLIPEHLLAVKSKT